MQRRAYVKVTGTAFSNVDRAMSRFVNASRRYHVSVESAPKREPVIWSKARAKLSGCEGIRLKRKVIAVKGERENVKRMLRMKIPEDVYIHMKLSS